MRKRFLACALVLCFIAAAGTAQAAAQLSSKLNGTYWQYTGFDFNATGDKSYVANGTLASSVANGGGGLEGVVNVYTGATNVPAKTTGFANSSTTAGYMWAADQDGPGNVGGLLAYNSSAAGNATWYVHNPSMSLLAGVHNQTAFSKDSPAFNILIQNQTLTNNTTQLAGTWYFYAVDSNGTNANANLNASLGTFTLGSAGTGSLNYYIMNNTGSQIASGTDTLTYALVSGNQSMSITGAATGSLADFAYLSGDNKFITGFNNSSTNSLRYLIALKGASALSTTDFTNKGYRFVSLAENGTVDNTLATIGAFYTDADRDVTAGNQTYWSSDTVSNISLIGQRVGVATASLGGVTHTNASYGTNVFLGRSVESVFAGIALDATNNTLGIFVMTPAGASVEAPAAPTAAQVTNMNAFSGGVTSTNGTDVTVASGVSASFGSLSSTVETAVGRFTNATDEQKVAGYSGLGSGAFIDNTFPVVEVARTGLGNGNIYVSEITFDGNNQLISELPVPTKFYPLAVTSPLTATVNAVNSTRAFTYKAPTGAIRDGVWWVTQEGQPTLGFDQSYAVRLPLGTNFSIWLAIQDGGNFDLDGAVNGNVLDPAPFIGGGGVAGTGIGSSSSDGGCVFNPAASLSAEFLLLLAVPAAWFIRRRKK
jgi:hypothetical protein